MEEKSIKIIIDENLQWTKKLSSGTYEVELNEEVGDSWSEVALYKLSTPYDFLTISNKEIIRVSVEDRGGFYIPTRFIVFEPGIYTIEEILTSFNTQMKLIYKLDLDVDMTPEDFNIFIDPESGKTVIKICNKLANPQKGFNSMQMSLSFGNLLGNFSRPNYINPTDYFFSMSWTTPPTEQKETFTSLYSNTVDNKIELFVTCVNWIEPQISNMNVRESKPINITNLIGLKEGSQLTIKNDNYLVWYKMVRSVKKTIIIQFSSGFNFSDLRPGTTAFLELLVRRPKPTNPPTEERLVNIVLDPKLPTVKKVSPGTYEVTLSKDLSSSWNDIALYKLDIPFGFYNISTSSVMTVYLTKKVAPLQYANGTVAIPAGNYTFEGLINLLNTGIKTVFKNIANANLSDTDIYFHQNPINLKTIMTANPVLSVPVQPWYVNALDIPVFIIDLLGVIAIYRRGHPARPILETGDNFEFLTFFLKETEKVEYETVWVNRIADATGLLVTSINWIAPQITNMPYREIKAIDVENLVKVPVGSQIVVKNDAYLNWHKLAKAVRQTMQITFSSGYNVLDMLPGVVGILTFIVRREKKITNI